MADLRFGDEGGSDAQEPEYNGSSTSTRLPPLHRHMQGQGSAECESAGCTRPLQLPSLSALGIADTIHKESATMQAGALAASHLASEEFGLTHKQQAQCLQEEATGQHHVNDIDDQNRQQLDQTTEASGCALEILAAASFQSEAEAEARLSRDEPKEESAADTNEGGLAASVQQCLWSTCTQIFSSIDELVRHLYKLHVATNRTSIYSRAAAAMERQSRQMAQGTGSKEQGRLSGLEFLCEWASCETRACGAEELIDHVCKDHLDAAQVLHRCGWAGCGCEYETIDLLTEHLSAEHIGSGRSSYVCRWDGCERAGKPFAQRQRALRHIQTHTGAKPFSCQVCTKRFSEAHIMQQHLRVHTGEKPFKCVQSGCGKEFAVSSALTIHRRTHTGEKPYECRFDGCTRRFAESSNLTKHMRIHTGERPFKCPQTECGKTFSRPDQVSRHRRIHTGQKPLPCPVDQCNKKFTTPSTRLNHLRSLHPAALDEMVSPPDTADSGDRDHSSKHQRLTLPK